MKDISNVLAGSPYFSELDEKTIEQIAGNSSLVSFSAGTMVLTQGTSLDYLLLIEEGEMVALQGMLWGEMEVNRMLPGEIVGELSLVRGDDIAGADVKALTPTTCVKIGRAFIRELWEQNDRVARSFLGVSLSRVTRHSGNLRKELDTVYHAMLLSIAELAESRDEATGAHLDRARNYCSLIAQMLIDHPAPGVDIPSGLAQWMYNVSPLHDIGKVAIPDAVLLKPGKLSDAEFEIMKTHPKIGAECMQAALDHNDQPLFEMARNICLYHHECWDGSGYPQGLEGDAIPIEARIMTVADVFDVMVNRRVYKKARPLSEAKAEVMRCAGTQFDPWISELMVSHFDEVERLHGTLPE